MSPAPMLRRNRQVGGDRRGFLAREIGQLDPMTDVERRPRRILDQIVRRRHADEDERDPFQLRIDRAVLVEKADRGEEIVGEIEAQRRVDLVDEQHEPLGPLDERDLAQIANQAVREGVVRMGVPPRGRAGAQPELLLHQQQKALVPLVGRGLGAELGEIDDDRAGAAVREPFRRAVHQARLAHLARRQDVGEVSGEAVLQQLAVRVPLQVDAAARLDGAAGDEHERVRHGF